MTLSNADTHRPASTAAQRSEGPAHAAHGADAPSHLVVADVSKRFPKLARSPGVHALGPIDLELRRGEFFALVGPSGCGKSTLLDIIAGLTEATSGSVTFEGQRVTGKPPEGLGVVLQEDASYPWLSVWNNIAFGLRRAGLPKDEITRRVDHALAFLGLGDFARAYPAQLSGGMRQRVCIGRTLVLKPRLILLDEPFGALDQQTRLLMGDELMRLWRETGATIFLITHSLDEAAVLADRVGVMSARPGRIIEVIKTGWPKDRTSDLYTDPDFGRITGHLWTLLRTESQRAQTDVR
jgi:NitT/TauT family transport system ATP-binding protein